VRARNFTPEEFGRFHPGGQLGRKLNLTVAAAMHTGENVAFVSPGTSLGKGNYCDDALAAGRRLRGSAR